MDEKKSWLVDDAFDYKGNPADSAKTGGWVPAVLILGIEMCERLSTMAIAVNLVTYLIGTMHLPSSSSANIVTNFMGISFLLCLFGGFLADSFLGRFKTVAIFSVVQSLGTAMLSFSTKVPKFRPPPCDEHGPCQRATGFQMGILYLSLCLIAMGTGGLKSSVSGFGSDQFDEKDEKEKAQMTAFFSRFFFFISLGTLIAVTVLVWLQDEVGRSWGYGICCISMVIAIVIFLSGVKKYRYKKSKGSPLVHILQVISAAVKKNKMQLSHDLNLFEDTPEGKRVPHTQQFKFLDKAAIVAEGDFENIPDASSPNPPYPWKLCSVTKVEEVKMMVRLLPVWATTIIFWTTYAQLITFSVEQASTMDRSIGSFQIPAGSLTVFFVSAILFTLAIYDQIIVPIWKKWKGKPGFSSLQRIAIGLVLATLGMIAAAMAEKKRLSVAKAVGRDTQTLPISVYYLIPQFFLVGSGEAFIYIGQLDFFITQSPKSMKTISTGIFLTTLSLGFFVSSFLVSVIKSTTGTRDSPGWLADNINYGRLDKFYWLLTTLSAINFVLFMMCAIWFKPPKKNNSSSRVSNASDGSFGEADEKC